MPCKICEEKLLEYLYGELEEEERLLMERHLEESGPCREVLESYRTVREAAAGAQDEDIPTGLHTRLLAHAEEARGKKTKRSLRAWLLHPALATVAVAAVGAVVYVHTIRTQGEIPLYDRSSMVLEPYSTPGEGEVEEYHSPYKLKDLQDPDAEEEVFVTGHLEKKEAPSPPPPPIKEAIRRADAPAEQETRTAMARTDTVKLGEARDSTPRNRLFFEDGPEGSFKSVSKGEPTKPLPSEPVSPKTHPSMKEADEADAGRPVGAPAAAGRRTKVRSRMAAAPLEMDSREISEKEARQLSLKRVERLTEEDRCDEARIWVYIFRARNPKDEETGRIWMKVARCFHRKGEHKEAEDAAREAMKTPSMVSEAETFLQSLPHPGPGPLPPD